MWIEVSFEMCGTKLICSSVAGDKSENLEYYDLKLC